MHFGNLICQTTRFTRFVFVVAGACSALNAEDVAKVEKKTEWKTTAALGFTLTQGNSDTVLINADLLGLKKWERNELSAKLNGSYGQAESEKNNEVLQVMAQYNRLLGEADFYFYGKGDLLHDAVADVEYRFIASFGAGYYLVNRDKMKLSAEVGPGYILEKLGAGNNDYFKLRVGERFDYQISERARLWQSAEWLPEAADFANYLLIAEIGVESDLTKKMSLRVSLRDNYDNRPAPGRKSNDLRLITGLGYKF